MLRFVLFAVLMGLSSSLSGSKMYAAVVGLSSLHARAGLQVEMALAGVEPAPVALREPSAVSITKTLAAAAVGTATNRAAAMPASHTAIHDSIQVQAGTDAMGAMGDSAVRVTAEQMEATAGTLDDPSRYFQTVAGVQSDSDQRNDFLVRGGDASENLFVIDGIEVPSINHLALSDTTGGLVSMVDADAVESMTLHAGAHDARFSDRLSSVVEISTAGGQQTRRTAEAGIAGVGGIMSWRLAGAENRGSALVSVRHGILDLLTSDVGLNGVPKYTNALLRGDRSLGARDKIWGMSLSGVDSIAIRPVSSDPFETNPFDVRYHGWRSTTGANWQHLWGAKSFGVATVSDAEQSQAILERDQLLGDVPTYSEKTLDGETTVKYEATSQPRSWLMLSGGAVATMERVNYAIDQPVPLPSPYSSAATAENATATAAQTATAIRAVFSTPTEGGFGQAIFLLPAGLRFTAATRVTHWGFDGKTQGTPRAFLSAPLGSASSGRTIGAGFAEYSQMPPFLYRLAFAQNHDLLPIRARHLTLDLSNLVRTRTFALQLAAYDKRYTDYPVAVGYPQLSLANVADTFGQSFLLFPMASKGRGQADGVEASVEYRPLDRAMLQGSVTYARCRYSGLDGVLRRGNFDMPLSVKLAGTWRAGRGVTLSARYDGASGRVYTPDDLAASTAQDRDVYDLTRINGARARAYGRMDFRIEQTRKVGAGSLSWHAGLENALGRKNFYEYVWEPRLNAPSEQDQMPRFPDGGVKYTF